MTKEQFQNYFKVDGISMLVGRIQECENCKQGVNCPEHKLSKKANLTRV